MDSKFPEMAGPAGTTNSTPEVDDEYLRTLAADWNGPAAEAEDEGDSHGGSGPDDDSRPSEQDSA
ncbi:MAG TPA: hypothetical protein VFC19_05900 [Candidatus Limnocylindrales bacterium]|nr:hypothetical protein [Candidatus Limnocylindrales bacterium]